jgi:uncharacterized protein (DUF1800 family)
MSTLTADETMRDESVPAAVPDRRAFLRIGAGTAAALAATAGSASAQPPRGRAPAPAPTGAAQVAASWQDPLLRLVRRVTMGLNPEEVALARRLGYVGYLEHHLAADRIGDQACQDFVAANYPALAMDMTTVRAQDTNMVYTQLQNAALYRAAFSKRQLHERMVEFWTDHFTISINKGAIQNSKIIDDREVIRRHALGNFREMLHASAKSVAMILYLDQQLNRTPTPNQNYAREIMELHTLGVNGGYTQDDVAALSRILTGWGVLNFQFTPSVNAHDWNAKTWMGQSFPAVPAGAGRTVQAVQDEGERAINFLLDHPSTARYLGWKLSRWLLQYDPPQSAVDAAAAAYTRTRGDIKAMIRAILTRQHLMAAQPLYKRPFHLAVSAIRSLGPETLTANGVNNTVRGNYNQMNMQLFTWEQPNGWPFQVEWWSGLVLQRWRYAGGVATTNSNDFRYDLAKFRSAGTSPEAVAARIIDTVFAGEVSTRFRSELTGFLRGTPATATVSDGRLRDGLSLAFSSLPYQWY